MFAHAAFDLTALGLIYWKSRIQGGALLFN